MTNTEPQGYGLLSETTSLLEESLNPDYARHLPPGRVFSWLGEGWRDLTRQPATSLAYGLAVFAAAILGVWLMIAFGWDYVMFPALSGFVILGPIVAVGLYEKSRALGAGEEFSLGRSLLVRPRAGAQVFFIGLLLCLLALLWMRAAVLIYALFFGYGPFPGTDRLLALLVTTPLGWAMIVTGTLVGGLFAAFAFAISVFSVPMMLDRRVDAVTAMGLSMTIVWNNLAIMTAWGIVVLVLLLVSALTGLLGLIIIFPLLGHATWHAYVAMGGPEAAARAR